MRHALTITAAALLTQIGATIAVAPSASAAPMPRADATTTSTSDLVPVRGPHGGAHVYIGHRSRFHYPYAMPFGPFGYVGNPYYFDAYPSYVRRCWVGPRTHRVYCRLYRRW